MPMEQEKLATELPQSSEWEVYKDVFALPHPTRRTKPWDREPVSAHAPRLHGQKIWKKAGGNPRGNASKENDHAQVELDLEGMGARKRMRGAGGKENISNAKWLLQSKENDENEIDVTGSLSPVKKDGVNFDADALLVPRKRTNANHLITPRRSKRKNPLQDVTQSSVENLPLPTVSLSPAVKPQRRTKSMRNSFRRLSRYDSVEEVLESQVKVVEANSESTNLETIPVEAAEEPASSQPVDIFGTSSEVVEGAQSNVEIVELENQPGICIDELPVAGEDVPVLEEGANEVEAVPNVPQLNILPTLVEEDSEPTSIDSEVLQDDITPTLPQESSMTVGSPTVKPHETPKKKVKSRNSKTPKTSPVKRSARITRSISLLPEVQPTEIAHESAILHELSAEARSPCKTQVTPKPRITKIAAIHSESRTPIPEVKPNMFDATQNSLANSTPPQIQGDLVEESVIANNEMEDIQEALNIEATEPFNFELPLPAESMDREVAAPSVELDSTIDFDLHIPELPIHDLMESAPRSTLVNDSHNLTSDDLSEISENLEDIEEITLSLGEVVQASVEDTVQDLPEPIATNTIEDTSAAVYNRDDTDLLRSFLTRVQANKAAKASNPAPKRKRSLPHSPIHLPLGSTPAVSSPSSPKAKDDLEEFDVSLPASSPSKRRKIGERTEDEDELTQPRTTRRSGRTRLPVKSAPLAAPSFIPLRRLGGQDGDNTVTLRRNEEKELATLTKFNTRKNKGGANLPPVVLAKKAAEKDDPAAKHKALKETFDDNAAAKKGKNKKGRNVVWAEEIAKFQTAVIQPEPEPILPPAKEEKKVKAKSEDKKPVKVGMRSKIALGMATNGTPAPKRQLKPRKK